MSQYDQPAGVSQLRSLRARVGRALRRRVRERELRGAMGEFAPRATREVVDATASAKAYWQEKLGTRVNPFWHELYFSLTGNFDPRFVPYDVWVEDILPCFNRISRRSTYMDKNLASTLLGTEAEVPSALKLMKGQWYDGENQAIDLSAAKALLSNREGEALFVKKATLDDGAGVSRFQMRNGKLISGATAVTLDELPHLFGEDIQVQPAFIQHPFMAAAHPASVNTIRVLTFRWHGQISVLLMFTRMGMDGGFRDNAGQGGLCRGVSPQGVLQSYAIDKRGRRYAAHPTSGFRFVEEPLIAFEALGELAIALHASVYHFDLVSWDFVIAEDETPRYLEMNFQGAVYLYQLASNRPLFGDLTEAVMHEVRHSRKTLTGLSG